MSFLNQLSKRTMNKIRALGLVAFGASLPVLGFAQYMRMNMPIAWQSIDVRRTCVDTSNLGPDAKQRVVREIRSYRVTVRETGADQYEIDWNAGEGNVKIVCEEY
jgi:hypothetical protein